MGAPIGEYCDPISRIRGISNEPDEVRDTELLNSDEIILPPSVAENIEHVTGEYSPWNKTEGYLFISPYYFAILAI